MAKKAKATKRVAKKGTKKTAKKTAKNKSKAKSSKPKKTTKKKAASKKSKIEHRLDKIEKLTKNAFQAKETAVSEIKKMYLIFQIFLLLGFIMLMIGIRIRTPVNLGAMGFFIMMVLGPFLLIYSFPIMIHETRRPHVVGMYMYGFIFAAFMTVIVVQVVYRFWLMKGI